MKTVIKNRYTQKVIAESELTLIETVMASKADLRGADLRGANLYDADLRGANLYGADLRGADLRGANLRGADLYGADLRGVKIKATQTEQLIKSLSIVVSD